MQAFKQTRLDVEKRKNFKLFLYLQCINNVPYIKAEYSLKLTIEPINNLSLTLSYWMCGILVFCTYFNIHDSRIQK